MMKKPIITRKGKPAEIISLELIKEYIGLDGDVDAEQDKILPVLRQAAIRHGEQITGIKWAAESCHIEGLWGRGTDILLPISPVSEIQEVLVNAEILDSDLYRFIPSAIDVGRPWGLLRSATGWQGEIEVKCTVGWSDKDLPEDIKTWVLIRIATLYDYREDVASHSSYGAMPRHHVDGLLDAWRVMGNPYG